MIIDQLPALATAGDNDEIAIEVGTTTYKITKSNFLKEFMPKSGGEFTGGVTVNGVLDVTNRRTNAVSLSALGWYRAIKIATGWRGARSFAVDICIGRSYSGANNEIHKITLLVNYDSFAFVNESSKSNSNIISAIRYTNDSSNGYIDIQYSSSSANNVYVDFAAHCHQTNMANFTPQSLQSVADSPSGETVLTEHSFTDNTDLHGLTVTRTENNYYDATAVSYILAKVKDDWLTLIVNLGTSTSLPASIALFEIAKIGLPPGRELNGCSINIPAQSGTGHILMSISSTGVIKVGNYSGVAITGFTRAVITIPLVAS